MILELHVQPGARRSEFAGTHGDRMKIRLAGDTLLLVEFEAVIDPLVNERVVELGRALRARQLTGVRDIVPGYCALGVHFDPLRTDLLALQRAVAADGRALEDTIALRPARVVEAARAREPCGAREAPSI